MTIREHFSNLPRKRQFRTAIRVASAALPIWREYADGTTLEYRDTVVGLLHKVHPNLLDDTIFEVDRYLSYSRLSRIIYGRYRLIKIHHSFDDPIVALQDDDWNLPHAVKQVFYSVFNLLEALNGSEETVFGEETLYVSVSQGLEALSASEHLSESQMHQLIY